MLFENLLPRKFADLLGSAPSTGRDDTLADPCQPSKLESTPAALCADACLDALEGLEDAELARLGLSRGVLALRAGCPDRMIDRSSDL